MQGFLLLLLFYKDAGTHLGPAIRVATTVAPSLTFKCLRKHLAGGFDFFFYHKVQNTSRISDLFCNLENALHSGVHSFHKLLYREDPFIRLLQQEI